MKIHNIYYNADSTIYLEISLHCDPFNKIIKWTYPHKEANDILELLRLSNAHPHFQAKYFAANGERGLDEYHEMAFKQYESYMIIMA